MLPRQPERKSPIGRIRREFTGLNDISDDWNRSKVPQASITIFGAVREAPLI
jgi:hypothetical protein